MVDINSDIYLINPSSTEYVFPVTHRIFTKTDHISSEKKYNLPNINDTTSII